ncbi:MAG: hypothetical protein AAFV53_26835 [Myxococcota bacterium]
MSNPYEPPRSSFSASGGEPPFGGAMHVYPPDVGVLLRRSWEIYQERAVDLTLGIILPFMVMGLAYLPGVAVRVGTDLFVEFSGDEQLGALVAVVGLGVQLLFNLLLTAVSGWATISVAQGILGYLRRGDSELRGFFTSTRRIPQGFLAAFVLNLLTSIGVCFCIVPGIIVQVGLFLWPWVMIDEDVNFIGAFQRSWELTEGHRFDVFLFFLVFGVLNFAAILFTCGLAGFVTAPLGMIATGLMYEGLRQRAQ